METVTEGGVYNFHHKGTYFFALKCIRVGSEQGVEFEKGDGSRIVVPFNEIEEPIPTTIH